MALIDQRGRYLYFTTHSDQAKHQLNSISLCFRPGYLLGIIVGCFPTVTLFAPKGAALIFSLAALTLLLMRLKSGLRFTRPSAISWLLAIFCGYALASSLWSVSPDDTLSTLLGLFLVLAGAWLAFPGMDKFSTGERCFLNSAIIIGGGMGLLLLSLEFVTNGSSSEFIWELAGKTGLEGKTHKALRPGTIVLTLFLWPWVWTIFHRFGKYWAIVATLIAISNLVAGDASAALLALASGVVTAVLVLIFKARFVPSVAGLCVLYILSAPFIPAHLPDPLVSGKNLTFLSNSGVHRLVIWQVTARHIPENPVAGIGLDGSRALYPRSSKKRIVFLPDIPSASWYIRTEPIPLHPHNLALQIWLELGVFGALLLCAFICALLIAIRKMAARPLDLACALGAFSGIFVIANISFGAWQSWWLTSVCLLTLICLGSCLRPADVPAAERQKNSHS